ncbi:ribosomal protein S18 acetylase RimI-like enzyme [Algoriphagus boseongensis]|uniref:Ribosomal protein S18 acetylase RimI-like enzyme n=1 Tax=Algoriphagus boseongensis TaxID=1442587 RepID=A0A4R6T2X3_9BACT|nr:GNAT family N-acetyltransferase [Algoriphagus boseongensis]TDQ16514.1 ribosomal protein S18 acetylase RimI-like enzyme [Algoriphagus boseongensis]
MNSPNFQIRLTEISDIERLVDVARKSFLQAFTAGNKLENVEAYLNEAFTLEKLEEEWRDPNSKFFIAISGSEILGYSKLNLNPAQTDIHDPESLEIARLYVLEEYLGKGVGDLLMEKAKEFAKQNQLTYLWLGVWEHNPRAIRFYEKKGFSIFGSHPFQFGDELQNDFLMRFDLE